MYWKMKMKKICKILFFLQKPLAKFIFLSDKWNEENCFKIAFICDIGRVMAFLNKLYDIILKIA